MPVKRLKSGVALILACTSALAFGEWRVNMHRGVTDISNQVYGLHMLIFWVCVVIGVIVFGVMFYSIIKHRKSKGAVASNFHENLHVELAWTLIPTAIVAFMGYQAYPTLKNMYDFDDSVTTVEIVGFQWKWRYTYLSEDPAEQISFFSTLTTPKEQIQNQETKNENYLLEVDEPLVLPVGAKVRFVLSSADVIHSWWVPQLGVKKDAIPGIVNEAWTKINQPGIYRGQCTELCGKDHGFMPIVVEALPQEDFDAWLEAKKTSAQKVSELAQKEWTLDELIAAGEIAYNKSCAACHQVNGSGLPPTFPALDASPIATGPIEDHIDIVLHGSQKNPAMAAFGAQLSEVELASIITYERNAWGNKVGDMVTPLQILKLKSGQ